MTYAKLPPLLRAVLLLAVVASVLNVVAGAVALHLAARSIADRAEIHAAVNANMLRLDKLEARP